jgi:hypothetical protein
MPIHFIPNDPLSLDFAPLRVLPKPRPDRKASEAGFVIVASTAAEGLHQPGTPEFLHWQCREAVLLTIEVYEQLHGPLKKWSSEAVNDKRLNLIPNGGIELNAFYDRENLAFFEAPANNKTTFSGASTDVVSHEVGHAFLDALRPELFGSSITEHGAFHESFGDCMAILTALFDQEQRKELLKKGLDAENPIEGVMEDLADGVKRSFGANHPAAAPRRALNTFKFALPTALPTSGPPKLLTSEIHSFGRIFTGCFYDVIRNIFAGSATKDEGDLLKAATVAGKLLVEGAKQAPAGTRFFQAVGRSMVLADDAMNGGAHRAAIGQAFAAHGIFLGSNAALMPRTALAGNAPKAAAIEPATLKDLRQRIGADPKAKFETTSVRLGEHKLVEAVHHRQVDLGKLGKELRDVFAFAPEPVVLGGSGGSAAVFSALPDPATTQDEVLRFVETLMSHNRLELDPAKADRLMSVARGGAKRAVAKEAMARPAAPRGRAPKPEVDIPTHTIVTQRGKKVLSRIRFLCPDCHC